jgi:hypothetical protein
MIPPFLIEEYKMVRETTASSLNEEVNRLIQEGWIIWGTPALTSSDYTQYYIQAMIKPKQPESRFVDENHPDDEPFPPEYFQL